jgi:hypothetical protein
MRKIVLTFGFIAGGVLAVMMLITVPLQNKIGWDHGAVIGYTTMVLAFLMVYFGVRSYRDNVAGGRVSFGRALAVGMLITMIATACYVTTWEFLYFKVMPDFADKYAAAAVDRVKKSGASAEKIAATTKEMDEFKLSYNNPLINIAYTTLEPLPVGILFALVNAGVLSRKRRPDGAAA